MRPLVAIGCVGLIACNGESMTVPCPPFAEGSTSPTLFVSGVFSDPVPSSFFGFGNVDPPGEVRVSAVLFPGTVPVEEICGARARTVEDATLRIMGVDAVPQVEPSLEAVIYELQFPASSAGFDTLRLTIDQLPQVEGFTTPVLPTPFQGIARDDPDTIRVAPDEDLRLHLRVPDDVRAEPRHRQGAWSLDVRGDTSTVTLSASGVPPDTLAFPAILIPESSGVVEVRMFYDRFGVPGLTLSAGTGSEFQLTVGLGVSLRWVFVVEEP